MNCHTASFPKLRELSLFAPSQPECRWLPIRMSSRSRKLRVGQIEIDNHNIALYLCAHSCKVEESFVSNCRP